jgi:hypothetical protein
MPLDDVIFALGCVRSHIGATGNSLREARNGVIDPSNGANKHNAFGRTHGSQILTAGLHQEHDLPPAGTLV